MGNHLWSSIAWTSRQVRKFERPAGAAADTHLVQRADADYGPLGMRNGCSAVIAVMTTG
jgi:hypothetical protein